MAWLSGYRERVAITIGSEYIGESLLNFPVLITDSIFTDAIWQEITREDIGDIRITSSDGQTVLNSEWSVASKTAESLSLFFDSVSLSADSDTTFYLYYGHGTNEQLSAATQQSTWGQYSAVWHMEETGTYVDSTENGNNGVGYVSSVDKSGKIKQGQYFDGSDYIDIPEISKTTGFSVSMWMKPDDKTNTDVIISNSTGFTIGTYSNGPSLILMPDGYMQRRASTATMTSAEWNHVVCSYDGSGIPSCFINGVETSYLSNNEWNSPGSFIGQRTGGLNAYSGALDEIRIMDSQANVHWAYAEYVNHNDITSFITIGEVEQVYPNYYHNLILNRMGIT